MNGVACNNNSIQLLQLAVTEHPITTDFRLMKYTFNENVLFRFSFCAHATFNEWCKNIFGIYKPSV